MTLTKATTAQPTFAAPAGPARCASASSSTTITRLHTDSVTIVVNGAPMADAGPDRTSTPATP